MWYFNPAAFAANDIGTFGNVGKGADYGPSLHNWDMGVSKNFRFNSSSYVQARVEFFNIFNQVNFDVPNTAVNNQARSAGSRAPIPARAIHAFSSSG